MNEPVTVAPGAADISYSSASGWAAELRATFALAWPLVIAQLAQNALHTTDVIMLGRASPA
jgi:MATE family multidrug resistance protein